MVTVKKGTRSKASATKAAAAKGAPKPAGKKKSSATVKKPGSSKSKAALQRSKKADPDAPNRSNPLGLDVDHDVLEFIEALDRFKQLHGRPFPSWSEVLHVLKELGYSKG